MEQNNAQVLFFQEIRSMLHPHLSVADEIAGVLGISPDSAYRRIRGEKSLTFDEIQKLCSAYNISVDRFLHQQTNHFIFTGKLGYSSFGFYDQYLNEMLQQFEFMLGFDHKHIYSLPKDIFPFVYFQFPELAAFTFFFYRKNLLHFEDMRDLKFSVKNLDKEHVKLGMKVQESFNRIPSTEIWSTDSVDSILNHIAFYRDTHLFESEEDVRCLYNKLEDLLTHLEKQAELGLKFNYGKSPDKNSATCSMYYNELITGDNCVLAETGNTMITYINHNLIHFMYTRDERFNNYTLETFKSAIRKSTQISRVGEKARARFFERLRKKIRLQKESINQY